MTYWFVCSYEFIPVTNQYKFFCFIHILFTNNWFIYVSVYRRTPKHERVVTHLSISLTKE